MFGKPRRGPGDGGDHGAGDCPSAAGHEALRQCRAGSPPLVCLVLGGTCIATGAVLEAQYGEEGMEATDDNGGRSEADSECFVRG